MDVDELQYCSSKTKIQFLLEIYSFYLKPIFSGFNFLLMLVFFTQNTPYWPMLTSTTAWNSAFYLIKSKNEWSVLLQMIHYCRIKLQCSSLLIISCRVPWSKVVRQGSAIHTDFEGLNWHSNHLWIFISDFLVYIGEI